MIKIGAITIGQSPRDDVVGDILPILGEEVTLLQAGGLDGLSREEIQGFAPSPSDYVLISRLRCIETLEDQGAQLILFLCTGDFPPVFHSKVPLIFPCKVLNGLVPALASRGKIAVVTPTQQQVAQSEKKWREYVAEMTAIPASPYGPPEELEQAAHQAAELDVDLVVMDCIGYTVEMKEHFQAVSGKPVVLSRTLAARVVMELLS